MAAMIEVTCQNKECRKRFEVRVADRQRGWGRFCSKSCKARKQERRTGQHRAYLHRQEREQQLRDANGGMGARDFQREYGGTPQFDRHGRYEGFTGGGFDNLAHQNHDRDG